MINKEIEFEIDELMQTKISNPIRNVFDIIALLLETIKYMLWQSPLPSEKGKLKIVVGKMNRIFYVLENKIFSITMPFFTKLMENGNVLIYDHAIAFNSKNIAIISSVFYKISKNPDNSVILSDIEQFLRDENLDEDVFTVLSGVIVKLLSTEYGYLRYDDDKEHEEAEMHPRYHLYINCANNCTYKLGLKKAIDYNWLRDCLDNEKPCKIINI